MTVTHPSHSASIQFQTLRCLHLPQSSFVVGFVVTLVSFIYIICQPPRTTLRRQSRPPPSWGIFVTPTGRSASLRFSSLYPPRLLSLLLLLLLLLLDPFSVCHPLASVVSLVSVVFVRLCIPARS